MTYPYGVVRDPRWVALSFDDALRAMDPGWTGEELEQSSTTPASGAILDAQSTDDPK